MIRRFARPYAKALSEVVTSPKEARRVYDELARFEQARRSSRELAELLEHPGIDFTKKKSVVEAIGKKLQLSPLGLRVLEVLAGNHRLNELAAILEAWKELLNRAEGVEVAEVRVAQELNETERNRLRQALETRFGTRIELQLSTDPALLGGLVARVGSEVYDTSVTGRIEKFKQSLHR